VIVKIHFAKPLSAHAGRGFVFVAQKYQALHKFPGFTQTPVGAALAANTGKAGACHRVACFAAKAAPTGAAPASGNIQKQS
ncbi:hypothetical protein, partial [Pseudomonas sp. 10-1B]|uniref:hypothetical protein n=1 Tax=Pseudomonas sp. 10-1B TaxID=1546029 RepID=UPI001F158376